MLDDYEEVEEVEYINNQKILCNAIRMGVSFTDSCELAELTPKEVTNLYKKNQDFNKVLSQSFNDAKNLILGKSFEAISEGDVVKFKGIKESMPVFVMWESFGKKDNLTDIDIVSAIIKYKYPKEIATSIGMTIQEYITLLKEDVELQYTLKEVNNFHKVK